MSNSNIWYPHKGNYDGKNPPYYYLDGIPWFDKIKSDLPQIKEAVQSFLKQDELGIVEYFNPSMVKKGWWGVLPFLYWNIRNEEVISKGPDVFKFFKDIPGIVYLSVSIMNPHTGINGHSGDTDGTYRLHIPVYIPAQLPECGLRVAGITRPWVENDIIAFNDAHYHEAWNSTNEPRVILIADVIKEEFLPQTDKICNTILAAVKYQSLALKYPFLVKVAEWCPAWMRDVVRKMLKFVPTGLFK